MRTQLLIIAALLNLAACAPEVDVRLPTAHRVIPSWGAGGSDGAGGAADACEPLPLVVPGVECIEGTTCKGWCLNAGACCAL